MQRGVLWRRELWRNGALMTRTETLWGPTGTGQTYFFFGMPTGFPSGQYEVKLFLGRTEAPIGGITFTIE